MTFKMWDLQDIGLVQWFKDGDHPDVKPFNDPKYTLGNECKLCGKKYKEHGLVKNPNANFATNYDHFHGANSTTVCPGDYVYKTENDNGVKQTVVMPEKMYRNVTDAIGISYHERTVDKGKTEIIYREYYCRDFSFNSDIVKILNTDWTQDSDNQFIENINHTHNTVIYTGLNTELYKLTTKTHKLKSKDYSHKSISYHGNFKFQRERTLNRHIQSDRYLNIDSFDIHFVQRQSRRCSECNLIIDSGAIVDLPDCRNCTYLNDAGDILDLRTCGEQAGVLGANGLPVLQEFHLWEWHGTTNSTLNSYGEKITNLENKSSASVDKVKDLEDRVKTLEDTIIDLTGRIVALGG